MSRPATVRRRLAELRRLTRVERCTLFLGWALLLLAPLLLRFVPLPRLVRLRLAGRGAALDPARVTWLVGVGARYAPNARCLPVALVTAWLLAWQETPATLRIGVARHAGRLRAHAWLECAGAPLPDAVEPDGYTPIFGVAVASS